MHSLIWIVIIAINSQIRNVTICVGNLSLSKSQVIINVIPKIIFLFINDDI